MKIALDPMQLPETMTRAIGQVNNHFSRLTGEDLDIHRMIAHGMKREVAVRIKAGEEAPPEFSGEAILRGIDVTALADLVLAKSDLVSKRELARQSALTALKNAKSPNELRSIIDNLPIE